MKLQDLGEAPLGRGVGAIKKSRKRLVAHDKLKPEARCDASAQPYDAAQHDGLAFRRPRFDGRGRALCARRRDRGPDDVPGHGLVFKIEDAEPMKVFKRAMR